MGHIVSHEKVIPVEIVRVKPIMESMYHDSNDWLDNATSISRNELREAARLLPQLLFTGSEDNGEDMNIGSVSDPVQNINDPVRNISDPVQNISDPVRNISDPARNITDTVQNISDPVQNISDPVQNIVNSNNPVKNISDVTHDSYTAYKTKVKYTDTTKDKSKFDVNSSHYKEMSSRSFQNGFHSILQNDSLHDGSQHTSLSESVSTDKPTTTIKPPNNLSLEPSVFTPELSFLTPEPSVFSPELSFLTPEPSVFSPDLEPSIVNTRKYSTLPLTRKHSNHKPPQTSLSSYSNVPKLPQILPNNKSQTLPVSYHINPKRNRHRSISPVSEISPVLPSAKNEEIVQHRPSAATHLIMDSSIFNPHNHHYKSTGFRGKGLSSVKVQGGTRLQHQTNDILQLTPSSGGAMSYKIAVSLHYDVDNEETVRTKVTQPKPIKIPNVHTKKQFLLTKKPVKIQQDHEEHKKEVPFPDNEHEEEILDEVPELERVLTPNEGMRVRQYIRREASLIEDQSFLVDFTTTAKTKQMVNKLRGGIVNSLEHLTDEIREDYDGFLTEIDAITYYAYRQAEEVLSDYSPQTVVLISSSVPNATRLESALKPNVLRAIYDFSTETYSSLLDILKTLLNSYKNGAKAKSLCIVCKGGPGYMYLLQRKPITPAKLLKDNDLLRFWKTLGSYMSKISLNEPSIVHFMECNVAGNKQGEELLSNLEAAMFSHKVKVESPLELEPKGRSMIATYFIPEMFKIWKSTRYNKFKLY